MWQCPNCKGKDVGKVGSRQFYCWNCLIEYSVSGEQVHVYEVEEDGSLSSLDDLFAPEELRLQP
ncbi:MAG: hypothetical protein L5657_08650 [Calditerricola sp.]|nr:hypothetical protein [Calditerricola sp.]